MKSETLRFIISGLRKFRLTEAEKEFVRFSEFHLSQNDPLKNMTGLILNRIYRQKTAFIRDSILSLLKQDRPAAQPGQVPNHGNEIVGSRL